MQRTPLTTNDQRPTMQCFPTKPMMSAAKKSLYSVALLIAGSLACCTSAGSHFKVDLAEIDRITSMQVSTMSSFEYVGCTSDRAYLKVWDGMPRLLGGGDHLYSIRIDELPAPTAAALRRGDNPWSH